VEIEFRRLSSWQRRDCINRSADHDCQNSAIIEAVASRDHLTACVRCCEEKTCMERATELAMVSVGAGSTGVGR